MRLDKVLDKNVESLSRLQKWHLLYDKQKYLHISRG